MTNYDGQAAANPAVDWARQNLDAGVDSEGIVTALIGQGWTELAARQVLDQALTVPVAPAIPVEARPRVIGYGGGGYTGPRQTAAYRSSAADQHLRNMRNGGILLAVGLAITVGTMSMGGVTILAWGPILFGGIRFITGFFGWIGSR